jgi:hypothetical protein
MRSRVPAPLIIFGSWILFATALVWTIFESQPFRAEVTAKPVRDLDACVAELDGVLHHLTELASALPEMRAELTTGDCLSTSKTHLGDVQTKVREALSGVNAMYDCLDYAQLV